MSIDEGFRLLVRRVATTSLCEFVCLIGGGHVHAATFELSRLRSYVEQLAALTDAGA